MSTGPGEFSPPGPVSRWRPATVAWFIALLGWTTLLAFYDLGDGPFRADRRLGGALKTAREMYTGPAPRAWSSLVSLAKRAHAEVARAVLGGHADDVVAGAGRGRRGLHASPIAVQRLLIVITVFWFTRRVAGDRIAVFSGFVAAASILVLYWSHRGASDLGLAALTTLSLATLWVAAEQEPPGRRHHALAPRVFCRRPRHALQAADAAGVERAGVPVCGHPPALGGCLWTASTCGDCCSSCCRGCRGPSPSSSWNPPRLAKWKVEFLDRFTGYLPNVEGQRAWYFHFVYLVPPLVYCLPFSLSLPQALARSSAGSPVSIGMPRHLVSRAVVRRPVRVLHGFRRQGYRYFLPAACRRC